MFRHSKLSPGFFCRHTNMAAHAISEITWPWGEVTTSCKKHPSILIFVASSRRSVSWGSARTTAREKKQLGERKRKNACGQTQVVPPTYRPPTETCNMTTSLWFWVVNLSLKQVHGIFQTALESQYLEASKHILQLKWAETKHKHSMANHRGVKLCKAKGQCTENRTVNVRMSRTVLQIFSHNLALSGSSRPLPRYLLPLLGLWFCSAVQPGISLWPRELDKPPWSLRRLRLLHSSETLLVERAESLIKLFQKPVGRIVKSSSIDHIFMQSSNVLCEGTSLREIFQLVVYNRFEHRVTHWKVSNHRHIAYLICVSNARVLTKSVKIDHAVRGYTRSWYTGKTFCLPTSVLSLLLAALFFIFSRAVFPAATWLTKCLEEAMIFKTCLW